MIKLTREQFQEADTRVQRLRAESNPKAIAIATEWERVIALPSVTWLQREARLRAIANRAIRMGLVKT